MIRLTVTLAEEKLEQLRQTAGQLGLEVDELVRRSIDEALARHQRVQAASDYVLQKNAELYRRLA